jgi:hypothetical protein
MAELLIQFDVTGDHEYIVEPTYGNRQTLKKFISKHLPTSGE